MNGRQLISGLVFFSFLFFAFLEGRTVCIQYAELPDSVRLEIRLTSHLLVPFANISVCDSFIKEKIPVALDCRGIASADLKSVKTLLSTTEPLIAITDSNLLFPSMANIIQVGSDDVDVYQFTTSSFSDSVKLPSFSCHELLALDVSDSLSGTDKLIKLWQLTGKKPNFILAKKSDRSKIILSIKELNRQDKIFGVVSSSEGLLSDVLLKDMPGRKINGYFSFPIIEELMLKPYKAGYQFSPDVIYNAPNNQNNMKVFRAVRLEPDFALSDHFRFDDGVKNICRVQDDEFIIQNVVFTNDSLRGKVAYFKNAYIDAGLDSRNILNSAFSISAWIKPTELGSNNSILGKGTNFVLKLHRGNLTFTMATIKDYISKNSIIEANQWTHVAVVYSEIEKNLKFYINGEKTDQISLIADYVGSDHSLLIGSNLWEEFFVGYIGDVKIWERELNEDEVRAEYHLPCVKKEGWSIFFWIGFSLFALFGGSFFFVKKRKAGVETQDIETEDDRSSEYGQKKAEKIISFGNLKILSSDNDNLFPKLSPKLRQLFVLILLYSAPGRKGVSSKKMSEFLWPGMSAANAKNTRGTSIKNLRQGIADCKNVTITFKDKMWMLEIDENVSCDYFEAEELLSKLEKMISGGKFQLSAIQQLVSVLKTGRFLQSVEASWLDSFKDRFSNRLIEICLNLIELLGEAHTSLQLDLAEIVSMYDELNETALQIKVCILNAQGKHGLAKSVYESYMKLYAELYNTDYPIDFLDLLKK